MKKLLLLLLIMSLLVSCDITGKQSSAEDNKTKDSKQKTNEYAVELEIDKDNIANFNNATDEEITKMKTWSDTRYEVGVGIKNFPTFKFDLIKGYRYRYINGPNSSWPDWFSYYVLRKGEDGNFYIIDYKVEEDHSGPKGERLYHYEYRCFRYYVSDYYLKLEESNMIFTDIFEYVNSHK